LYFFPGLNVGPTDQPIFKYSKGKKAYGPDPDSTINGYKLFTNDPERRMFLVNEAISRVYHIDPPDGEFVFGYVVDASWAPPETTPVTDPMNDFPFWANCEDGYVISVAQLEPFEMGTYEGIGSETNKVTRSWSLAFEFPGSEGYFWSFIYCPDIVPDQELKSHCVANSYGGGEKPSEDPRVHIQNQNIDIGTYEAEPGSYLALFVQSISWCTWYEWVPMQFANPLFFDFIYLDVVDNE